MSLRDVRLIRRLFVEILRVGAPDVAAAGVQQLQVLAVLTGFVGALGAAQLAAFGIAARLEYLLYPLAFGLGAGVIALVGTNLGAGRVDRAASRHMDREPHLRPWITGSIGLFGVTAPNGLGQPVHRQLASFTRWRREYLVIVGLGLSAAWCRAGIGLGISGRRAAVMAAARRDGSRRGRHIDRLDRAATRHRPSRSRAGGSLRPDRVRALSSSSRSAPACGVRRRPRASPVSAGGATSASWRCSRRWPAASP